MSRRMIVAGNWKMNLGRSEAVELAKGVAEAVTGDEVDVAVFPTFPWLVPVSEALGDSGVVLGAQDCYVEESGAFTGEVSPAALSEICGATLAGHSERRHVIGESNDLVGRKVNAILSAGMTAYLCVGETLEEREDGRAESIVQEHLSSGLASVDKGLLDRIVIAYEPVWAIGTGVAASSDDAQAMCRSVREWMGDRYGDSGRNVRVLPGRRFSRERGRTLRL
ncbi:MAG: triose-phosphate isomerase [Thermomicrobiales bacterium]